MKITRIQIIILWLCITLGLIMHTAQEVINYIFFVEMPEDYEIKEGIPNIVHVLNIVPS